MHVGSPTTSSKTYIDPYALLEEESKDGMRVPFYLSDLYLTQAPDIENSAEAGIDEGTQNVISD